MEGRSVGWLIATETIPCTHPRWTYTAERWVCLNALLNDRWLQRLAGSFVTGMHRTWTGRACEWHAGRLLSLSPLHDVNWWAAYTSTDSGYVKCYCAAWGITNVITKNSIGNSAVFTGLTVSSILARVPWLVGSDDSTAWCPPHQQSGRKYCMLVVSSVSPKYNNPEIKPRYFQKTCACAFRRTSSSHMLYYRSGYCCGDCTARIIEQHKMPYCCSKQ